MLESLQVEYRALDRIVPYARNARDHSAEQVEEIAGSIRSFGFVNPILVGDDGEVVAGHGRLAAAQLLGLKEAPVIVLRGLSEVQRRQLVLADNRIALNAGWNSDMLALELSDLRDLGADLQILGFSEEELAAALSPGTAGQTDPDDAPEVPADPVSRAGDLWALGAHRLLCGDSTSPEAVKRALGAVCPMLMVTDPPYGVDYDAAWRSKAGIGSAGAATGKVENDDRADWRAAWALFPGNVAYVWHGSLHVAEVADSLAAAKFQLRSHIVWVKTRPVISRGNYHWQHEPALYAERSEGEQEDAAAPDMMIEHVSSAYAVRTGKTANWRGGRKQSTVWFIEHIKSETGHSTQKPVECMRRPIVNNSSPGQAVYDPFLGSGTTIIAAEMEGRACIGLEIDPAYCDVIVKRWQDFTGKAAELEGGGSFEAVAAERKRDDGSRDAGNG